jgi:hypothetical protein
MAPKDLHPELPSPSRSSNSPPPLASSTSRSTAFDLDVGRKNRLIRRPPSSKKTRTRRWSSEEYQ